MTIHESIAADGEDAVQGQNVYVYEAPVRIWHWVNAFSILTLALTGYFIGSPLPSVPGEASANFLMGYIRFMHFAAGQVLAVFLILRLYWAFVGNVHARQIFYVPFWSGRFWKEWLHEVRWYTFLARQPKKYVGHNPLAQLAMLPMFTLPLFFMVITGFALYSEGAGRDSLEYALFGWVFSIWPNSQDIHTFHHLGMWVILVFVMVHIYVAVREDIMCRQSIISSMISGERLFKDRED
ncbi:Ni/Fe-hydrogenase 1 B-type cytochrome subunit [Sinorhizobium kostiense]|uniref:Ni/Fe-hydrogenase 1 B-type cytochrome subunit n=1 Tax=Sinorhizobium kostiense TaxID=76747 RepID=A0ABS4R2Z5_9HYPH|nr:MULTISPECIES: Ni/Fe-hydrogenase, b-type cytochrome subunit [Sinorhizobium]MBP2236222.1 Ni/Fe-hydrogenase 1 B-type cytochrome subunit [Sinorhizobium kostiense]